MKHFPFLNCDCRSDSGTDDELMVKSVGGGSVDLRREKNLAQTILERLVKLSEDELG